MREPNAALLLGPRIGRRLGEAGDREICRRSPGAAGSAEPLRRFERIGEVRCYSRLNVGRHSMVSCRATSKAATRLGAHGVEFVPSPFFFVSECGTPFHDRGLCPDDQVRGRRRRPRRAEGASPHASPAATRSPTGGTIQGDSGMVGANGAARSANQPSCGYELAMICLAASP